MEMAIVMPLLLTMLFGIIEYGWMFNVRQGLSTAAREGARTATLPGSTEADVQARVNEYLAPLGITSASVTLTRATEGNPTETVSVIVPYADVTLVGDYFGTGRTEVGAKVSMRKEGF